MDLMNIKKVEDLTIMGDVNRRLEQGWVLIGTYTNNYDAQAFPGETTFHYVIGLSENVAFSDTPQYTNYAHSEDLEEKSEGLNM
jgi:hypothetical protein